MQDLEIVTDPRASDLGMRSPVIFAACKLGARLTGRGGFSLLEMLFALVVLAIGFLATLVLVVAAMNGNAFARKMAQAGSLAQVRIEKARSVGFSALAQSDGELCIDASGVEDYGTIKLPLSVAGNCSTQDPAAMQFRRETVVAQIGNLKTVTVTVRWRGLKRDHSMDLSTVVAQ